MKKCRAYKNHVKKQNCRNLGILAKARISRQGYVFWFTATFLITILSGTFIAAGGRDEADVPENGTIAEAAESQIGNKGGEPYWSWYGFDEHVDWCACFVSWCADKCGYIDAEKFPRFSYCPDGVSWFISNKSWYQKDISPKTGMIIFFDRNHNGTADHVGIVKQCKSGIVHTIEGNSHDRCRERKYRVGSKEIYGYGTV